MAKTARRVPSRVLEVHFDAEPEPPRTTQEVVRATNEVIQRVRCPVLLGDIEVAVAVAVPLLRPDERDAVWSSRSVSRGQCPAGTILMRRGQGNRAVGPEGVGA